jgi:hypothetical protein
MWLGHEIKNDNLDENFPIGKFAMGFNPTHLRVEVYETMLMSKLTKCMSCHV